MAVSTINGSLDYTSRLDNSDFQAKSLQDLKLIELRLRLTGDVSGIEKYDAAVKTALDNEIKLRNDLDKILEDAKIKTQEVVQEITQPVSKTVFSDSAAEVEAYQASLAGLESGAGIVAGLNEQLDLLAVKETELNTAFAEGTITEIEHTAALEKINIEQIRLVENIRRVNDAYATNVIIEQETVAATERTTVAVEEEINAYTELTVTLRNLKAARANPQTATADLPLIARQIQETEAELLRATNAGKVGFDEFGKKIKNFGVEAEGAAVKQGLLGKAVERATSLQAIGARVISQFSRQIIGLGVGYLSLVIGAKAIESLIEYIKNLDIFSGRLDQARQNVAAFNDVMKEADKEAGKQIGTLKVLYDTATDTNKALAVRLDAAEQLRDSYAAEFANADALTIANGKLKGSYDELSDSILKVAKSQAAGQKIGELAGKILDAQFEIDKNNAEKAKRIREAKAPTEDEIQASDRSGGGPSSLAEVKASIKAQTDFANKSFAEDIRIAKGQITFLEQFINTTSKKATDLQNANKLLGTNLQNFNNLIGKATDETDLQNIKAALEAKLKALVPSDAQFKVIHDKIVQVQKLIDQYKDKPGGANKIDPAIGLLASQKKVLQDVDALKNKYASKDKTRNEQEVDDVKAAYQKEYDAIVAQNAKLAQYLKTHTPQQARAKGLQYIDPNSIQTSEDNAVKGLQGRQSVEDTKVEIAMQKALFTEYEAFKLQAGTEAANKLFANELKSYTSYIEYLKGLQPTEGELTSSDPYVKARASALNDYLKIELPKAQEDELKAQQKHLQDLIIQDQNWQQKRLTLIATANENIKKLQDAGFKDQAIQAKDNLQEQLTALEISGFETQAQYRKLFTNITELSTEAAKTQIKNAKAMADALHAAGILTDDAYRKITQDLQKLGAAIGDRQFDKLEGIGAGLNEIGKAFEGINSGFGSYIQNLGSLVSSLGNVGKQYDQIAKDAGDAGKQTMDYINLAATGISALFNLIGGITSAAAKRKQDATDYYNSVIAFQNQYNLALNEQIRLQYQTDQNIFFTNYTEELQDAAKALTDADKKLSDAYSSLAAGQAKVGQKNIVDGKAVGSAALQGATAGAVIGSVLPGVGTVIGGVVGGIAGAIAGIFGGKKKADVLAPLLVTYPDLIKKATDGTVTFNEALAKSLIANNQVSDSTKVLLQNTIDLNDARQAAIDQINSALSELSSNLGSNLEDALVTAFENGTDAAKAFGDTVSDVIGNIVKQFLFEDIFGEQFKKLQASLQNTVQSGGSSADITADIEQFFKDAGPLVKDYEAGLQAAKEAGATLGLTLFPSAGSAQSTSLSGGIQASLTENTADILAGTFKGIQLGIYNTNQNLGQLILIAQDQLNAALAIQVNTRQTADYTANLPDMLNQLKAISTNTEGSLGIELRAAGFYKY